VIQLGWRVFFFASITMLTILISASHTCAQGGGKACLSLLTSIIAKPDAGRRPIKLDGSPAPRRSRRLVPVRFP